MFALSAVLGGQMLRAQNAAPTTATTPAQVTAAAPAQGGTIKGTVIAGIAGKAGTPLPGVAVTATNTLTGKKYTTATDIDGVYAMKIPKNGRYVIKAELTGFALETQEVVITSADAGSEKKAEFGLQLASRAAAAEAAQTATATTRTGAAMGRGTVSLNLGDAGLDATDASASTGNTGTTLPALGGLGDSADATSDSIAVSGGAQSQMNGLAGISEEDLRNRVEDAVAQGRASGLIPQGGDPTNAIVGMLGGMMGGGGFGGGPGGGGGGRGGGGRGGGGGFGGGAFRNLNPAQPHGSIFYQGANNALNSAQWSPTLQPTTQPDGYQNNYGLTLGMSPYIPGLTKPNTKQFVFINLTGKKTLTASLYDGLVPTAAERAGNFSGATLRGVPIVLYDPTTGNPIPGNNLANATVPISQQALNLLNTGYYPLPNITPNVTNGDNYQTVTNAGNNTVAINSRYVRTLGSATNTPFGRFGGGAGGGTRQRGQNQNVKPQIHQNINISYNYQHAAADQRQIFLPLGGATQSDGNALNVGYTLGYGRLSNNASITWNRLDAKTRNYFTDTANNPSATIGLNVPNMGGGFADPRFYNGLASFSFGKFTGLSNQTPSQTINQTISFTDFVAWRKKKHNIRIGFDLRRVHNDQIGGNNPLGSYDFTGYATESPTDQANNDQGATGSGFADFLLGLPQTTSIQAGLYKDYLRENVYDWYAQDDFRVASNLTLNYGIRYEYFGPYTEKNNRLVNLTGISRTTPATSGIGCVSPVAISYTSAAGTVNCSAGTGSLVNPDRAMFAPRFGFAYRPNQKIKLFKDVVVRGGYGINYNTGAFVSFAQSLSHQTPFAVTQTNTLTSGCTTTTTATRANMTLANGFGCSSLYAITNNYAVDPNYRLGMTQVYNLNIQKTLPLQTVFNIGYNGTKASGLDIYGTPNGTTAGSTVPGVAPFDYETSGATLHSNQLVVSLQKRQQKGIAVGATYTYGHAIDDASAVGNGAARTPMQNFYNLRGEEGNSSLDVRHSVTGNWVAELPFGPNRMFLNKGGVVAKVLDSFNVSGNFTFASGTYLTPTYSGTEQANSGNTFTQRPNRDYTMSSVGPGSVGRFFNTSAFTVPTGYGTAAVDSIEGPGTVSVTASLSRTIQFKGTNSLETRVTASNVFNTVQYSGITTNLYSGTFGQVQSAANMRAIQYQARYRF